MGAFGLPQTIAGLVLLLAVSSSGQAPDGIRCEPPSRNASNPPEWLCKAAFHALELNGRRPYWKHPEHHASNMQTVVWLTWCESRWRSQAFNDESPKWGKGFNRARGLAQIGDAWDHIASDNEAFDPYWTLLWIASDASRVTKAWYPECGLRRD